MRTPRDFASDLKGVTLIGTPRSGSRTKRHPANEEEQERQKLAQGNIKMSAE